MTRKKTTRKSKSKNQANSTSDNTLNYNNEFLILGHLVKYNMYLLTKAVIFSALCQKVGDVNTATDMTNKVLAELDLDVKQRSEMSSNISQEELQ